MKITHRIRSTTAALRPLMDGHPFILGLLEPRHHEVRLRELGFSFPLIAGEQLLPATKFGRSCAVNAEGWIEKHTNQPKETAYRTVLWTWRMRRGYGYEEDSRIVNVPYKRYPRTEHPPFGRELRIIPMADGQLILALPQLEKGVTAELEVVTCINLLVELFGECDLLTEDLTAVVQCPIRRMNWDILPPGELPWAHLQPQLTRVLANRNLKDREVFAHRFELLNSFRPDFCAIGKNGFHGYVIFGFPNRDFYLLESIHYGNATYGLGSDWEEVSRLTKAQILSEDRHRFRVIHSAEWDGQIRAHFARRAA